MKHKAAALLLAVLFPVLTLAGCVSAPQKQENSISIVTTIFAPYDFARNLTAGMEDVSLSMLLKPGMESHSFEPTPQDIITVQNADLFLYVGGESDAWVDTILKSVDASDMTILTLMDCAALLPEEHTDGMVTEPDSGETEYDEHVWTSPKNAMRICEKIEAALCEIAPEKADAVHANAADYQRKLTELDEAFSETISGAKRQEIIMGDRFPFLYFAKEYGLTYYAAFPGCAAQTEPNPKMLTFLIDKVKQDGIPAVFYMEMSNRTIADAIAEATGAKPMLLHACHNIAKDDFDAGETYLSLMEKNLSNLKEALN